MHTRARQPRSKRSPSWSLRLLRGMFRRLGPWLPRWMGAWAFRLWFATHRSVAPARESAWLAQARRGRLQVRDMDIATWQWGDAGPPVLLVHGWNGRGAQLGAFAEPLVRRGYRVLTFDAPGHGASSGRHSTIFRYVETIDALQDEHGPLAGIIAHSFGVPCACMAAAHGLAVTAIVGICPPASMDWLLRSFATALELPGPVLDDLRRRLDERFGQGSLARLGTVHNAAHLRIPGLVIHDLDDRDVPVTEGRAVAAAWPGARLLTTHGLGHQRILRDQATIGQAVEFLCGIRQHAAGSAGA